MKLDISVFISILAFIVSFLTFLFNFISSLSHIEIKNINYITFLDHKDEDGEYVLAIDCIIENRNKFPIKIYKIKFNNFNSFSKKIRLARVDLKKYGQTVRHYKYSLGLPIKLDAYESEEGAILINSDTPIKVRKINLLKLYSTRGVLYIFLRFHNHNK